MIKLKDRLADVFLFLQDEKLNYILVGVGANVVATLVYELLKNPHIALPSRTPAKDGVALSVCVLGVASTLLLWAGLQWNQWLTNAGFRKKIAELYEKRYGDGKNMEEVKMCYLRRRVLPTLIVGCFTFFLACFVALTGCGRGGVGMRVGVIGPFTGAVASYGDRIKNAAELARDQINKAGGINGQSLDLLYQDTQCLPEKAVAAVENLISVYNVQLILGDTCSSATFAAGTVAERRHVVLFTPISSADNISAIGKYVFRLAPYDSLQARVVAKWLSQFKRVGILYINNDYGVGLRDAFRRDFEVGGRTVAIAEGYAQGDTDFRGQWLKIRNAKVEAVFVPAYPSEAINLLRQRKELGITTPVYGTDPYHDPTVLKSVGGAADGVFFTDVSQGTGGTWDTFRKAYRSKYGSEPNVVAAESYDSVKLAAEVMGKYGTSADQIGAGFSRTKGYMGATGLIEFNEHGDCVTHTFDRYMIKDGQYVLIK